MAEAELGRLLLEGHRALAADLVSEMEERGFTDVRAGHAAVFLHIDRRSGTRLTELSRRAGMTKQGMMLVVDDLEERGYVRRVPDVEDARAKVVRLTAIVFLIATALISFGADWLAPFVGWASVWRAIDVSKSCRLKGKTGSGIRPTRVIR